MLAVGEGDGSTTYSRFMHRLARRLSFRLHLRRQNHGSAILRRILRGLIHPRRRWPVLVAFLPIFLGLRRVRHVALDAPLVGELARQTQIAGAASQEIRIDGNDHIGLARDRKWC